MDISVSSGKIIAALREKRPLVHCITNYVTAGDTANMLLAAGASPVMADDPGETAEAAAAADALVLNMGTLSEKRIEAMLAAGKAANAKGIPVILDPVGVQLSAFRKNAAAELLANIRITAVRGNASELSCLAGAADAKNSCGVDCIGGDPLKSAHFAAEKLGCVCAATGRVDIITDGKKEISVSNGCAELKRVTGTGCMTTALCAAFSAVTDPMSAAAAAIGFMGICGETAYEKCGSSSMGSFRAALFDAASMSGEFFSERLKAYDR